MGKRFWKICNPLSQTHLSRTGLLSLKLNWISRWISLERFGFACAFQQQSQGSSLVHWHRIFSYPTVVGVVVLPKGLRLLPGTRWLTGVLVPVIWHFLAFGWLGFAIFKRMHICISVESWQKSKLEVGKKWTNPWKLLEKTSCSLDRACFSSGKIQFIREPYPRDEIIKGAFSPLLLLLMSNDPSLFIGLIFWLETSLYID